MNTDSATLNVTLLSRFIGKTRDISLSPGVYMF